MVELTIYFLIGIAIFAAFNLVRVEDEIIEVPYFEDPEEDLAEPVQLRLLPLDRTTEDEREEV